MAPTFFSPCLAVTVNGLCNYLGISPSTQIAFGSVILNFASAVSIKLAYIRYKAVMICEPHGLFRILHNVGKAWWIFIFFILYPTAAACFKIENIDDVRNACAVIYKGSFEKFYDKESVFLTLLYSGFWCFYYLLCGFVACGTFTFFIVVLGYLTFAAIKRLSVHMSDNLLKRNIELIRVLYLQTLTNIIFINGPAVGLYVISLTEWQIQDGLFYCIYFGCIVQAVNPIFVFYGIRQYRDAIYALFR